MIKDLPELDKPREKALRNGVQSLSDSELLAIVIRTGTKKESALKIAQDIINCFNGINNFHNLSIERLSMIKGIGKVKAITILSSLELGRRSLSKNQNKVKIKNAKDIYELLKYQIVNETQELFYILFLNNNSLLGYKLVYKGTSNKINVCYKDVFKESYIHNSTRIILVHNHPNGLCFPSKEDYQTTKDLTNMGKLLGVSVIDHIILTADNYYSFYENGDFHEE